MKLLPTIALSIGIGQGFLTGDFRTDLYKLQNCSLLENLYNRKKEFTGSLTHYEMKLLRAIDPWYRANCK